MPAPFTQDLRQGLADAFRSLPTRATESFDVPLTMEDEKRTVTLPGGRKGKIVRLVLAHLTAVEEQQAAKRCGGDPSRLGFMLAQASLTGIVLEDDVQVPTLDGLDKVQAADAIAAALEKAPVQPLQLSDGSTDGAWNGMTAAMRQLTLIAYGEIATPKEEDQNGFLKSRRRRG